MRTLCIDEIGGVEMKKMAKIASYNSKKHIFFTASFWLLLCISKMICRA
jgi:hypothetical protein